MPKLVSRMLHGALCAGGMTLAGLAIATPATAAVVHWDALSGGNGNYYEVVQLGSATWTSARSQALSRSHLGLSGYLASITSAEEMSFISASFGPFSQHVDTFARTIMAILHQK